VVDVALFAGRILLLALLYLFLFADVRAGLGLVRRGAPSSPESPLMVVVVAGPPELSGVRVALDRTVRIGRSPDLELVIADDFVSTEHARIVPTPQGVLLEDLDSTNGTLLNGARVKGAAPIVAGDEIEVGTVKLKVSRS
jgi:pSer/pThr/pTyr-binding forkhead associated (FHA) protein